MSRESENLSDEQFRSTQAAVQATTEWMANEASDSDLMVSNSSSRLITDPGNSNFRVNFDGKTTRFRPNTEVEVIKGRIASCREAYENAGIVTNAIDLMVDFALEGITVVHESKPVQRFYEKWMKKVKLGEVIEQILKSYFVDSNVPILSFRGRISAPEVRRFRLSVGSQTKAQRLFVDPDITKRRIIPYKFAILDILRLHMEGADLIGNMRFEYDLEADDKKRITDPSAQQSDDLQKIRD
jgi:hypothetical protein